MTDEEREQFDKREGAARIARAAAGTFPIFEQSVAWYTMIRAIKMAQDEVRKETGQTIRLLTARLGEKELEIAKLEARLKEET